jgi:hypothetical protein
MLVVLLASCTAERQVARPEQPAKASNPEEALLDWPAPLSNSQKANPAGRPQGLRHGWPGAACGVELWDVKTATDPLARHIDPTPRPTTIADLVSLPRPRREGGARINGAETTTWVLTNVSLLMTKRESDQDYHLVVGDGRHTMIVEIADPACVDPHSMVADGIASARRAFETHLGDGWAGNAEIISVAGVGFFDRPHNQTGAAFNQIELHPVTAICFGRDCKLDIPTGAQAQAQSREQVLERERKAALEADVAALCHSRNTALRTMAQYQQVLASCRGRPPPPECARGKEGADAEVRSVIIKANDDENAFLRKWGSEAFVEITCDG